MNRVLFLAISLVSLSVEAGVYRFKTTKIQDATSVVSKIQNKNGSLELSFLVDELETSKADKKIPLGGGFSKLNVKGLQNTHKVGAPELPYYSMLLVGRPSDFDIKIQKGSEYELEVTPSPYQKLPCRCEKDPKEFSFNYDPAEFENSGSLIQKVDYLGDFKGIPLTHLVVTPFQYKENNGLKSYPELKVFISSKTEKSVFEFSYEEVLKSIQKSYVIFSPREYHGALSRLVTHKNGKGFDVEVVAMEDLGSDYESIKNSIHAKYKKKSFDYALIVGHEEKFPTSYVVTSNDMNTPSDLGYFTMTGKSDNIPDVFYGRMTADSVSDVENQISKIIEYEERSWNDGSGVARMMGVASDEGWNPTDVEYMRQMTDPFAQSFSTEVVHYFQENDDSSPENMNKTFNQGVGWFNYIGHGSGYSWSSVKTREYDTGDIEELSPDVVKPVLIDVACQNGRFSLDNRLGERFMNQTKDGRPVGAVAFYGGSVDISWHPPAVMAVGLNQIVANNPNQTLGGALLAGQIYLIQNFDDRVASTENLKWYHLQGDPTLQLQLK